jgi:hypothetical protein
VRHRLPAAACDACEKTVQQIVGMFNIPRSTVHGRR